MCKWLKRLFGSKSAEDTNAATNNHECCRNSKTALPADDAVGTIDGLTAEECAAQGTSDGNSFEDQCLKAHNDYRNKHGVPPLTINKKLTSFAQEWSNHLAKIDKMEHRQNNKHGENLYFKYNSNPANLAVTGQEVSHAWYSEIKFYKFASGAFSPETGHFTQLIWKDTKEVGFAFTKNKHGKLYAVAEYDPPGNFQGKFNENVLKAKKGSTASM